MRKVLNYDHSRLGQDTTSYCGPATVQTILSAHGRFVDEATLAAEMGTDDDGTDYVGLLGRTLSQRLNVAYRSVEIPNDPPTREQTHAFWTDLHRSIDAGYGVAMNWVAPASNRPQGILGTGTPNYPAITTWHYVAALGYDDEARAVWVVDSGFDVREYFVSLGQCVSLIAGKAYAYADVEVAPEDDPLWADVLTQLIGPR